VTASRIRQGDIFWLDDCPPLQGDIAKRRPVVVISPTKLVETRPDALVVACTSSVLPSDTSAIELPSRERTPQTRTGLNRRTWAIPRWLLPVQRELLVDYIGQVSGPTLRRLLEGVAKAQKGK
jgi:mRNA-degrading endonuclease toxin of MazEF toxin-antitoxin module